VASHILQIDDNEVKLLLAAVRQVQHTFTIAEAQSTAAGEPLAADYETVREAYERLEQKLKDLAGSGRPHLVK
jgi:hypothetical protein